MGARLTWTSGVSEQVRLNRYRIYRATGVDPLPEDFVHLIDYPITYSYDGEKLSETLTHLDNTAVSGTTYSYYIVFDDDDDRNRPFSAQSNITSILQDATPPGAPTLEGQLVVLEADVYPLILTYPNEGTSTDPLTWSAAVFGTGHAVSTYSIYAATSWPAIDFGHDPTLDDLVLVGTVDSPTLSFSGWPAPLIALLDNVEQQSAAYMVVANNGVGETLQSSIAVIAFWWPG